LHASTKSIGDKAYGSMILGIDGGGDTLAQVMEFLDRTDGISVQEVNGNE
jgi:D-methionine transport system ATP-binding protein